MADLEQISEMMQKGKAKEVKELCQEALDAGISAQTILDDALLAAMNIVGIKFKNNQVFVPEVLIAARAMNAGLEILKSELEAGESEVKGKVVLGTVKGDLHDIGKNLVKIMLEGKGLEVIDLGTDVSPEQYVEAAKTNNANIIAVSALLTTTMTQMENVVKAAEDAGIRDKITIMIGGAPVTQSFCDSIGADIYTPDASTAADKAMEVCLK
ncbi:cobalamin-binding protein [Oceanispirochaeta crateris]|uniref:Cobalamin-binding protein n=1 Tax=Oceanispirochaeta crateris TaxID=2518645 RepID=A0A5C1QNU4_9SPIO|nr:corrinoid protein [Oceanispirochaeta crateris]QEN08236.1 cobalamin-binding protein [Oceanispirochaeta crateris]